MTKKDLKKPGTSELGIEVKNPPEKLQNVQRWLLEGAVLSFKGNINFQW